MERLQSAQDGDARVAPSPYAEVTPSEDVSRFLAYWSQYLFWGAVLALTGGILLLAQ